MRRIAALPAMLTLGNAFCGFASIGYAASARAVDPSEFGAHMEAAGWFVLLAMVFDALDGKVARLVRAESDLGVELDSLADVISFGVAPAIMTLVLAQHVKILFFPRIAWASCSLYMICAVMRLARYNVVALHEHNGHNGENGNATSSGSSFFTGLPSPAAAGVVASLVMTQYYAADKELMIIATKLKPIMEYTGHLLPIVVALLAVLMVSRIRYVHVLNRYLKDQEAFGFLVAMVFVAVFIFFTRPFSIPLAFLVYVGWGLGGALLRRTVHRGKVNQSVSP